MATKIEDPEHIRTIFLVFHDGLITRCAMENSSLEISVRIDFLAKRINPSFTTFTVTLENAKAPYFIPWLDDTDAEYAIISDIETISTAELEIYSCEIKSSVFEVYCNQYVPNNRNVDGCLYLKAESAIVKDEAGKQYSIEELVSLSNGYWDEWDSKKQK